MAAAKKAKATAKSQGVPDAYLTERGTFKPGYDARYKSDLVKCALDLADDRCLTTFTVADAKRRLTQRGWTKFLDAKRKSLAAKTKTAARNAKEAQAAE